MIADQVRENARIKIKDLASRLREARASGRPIVALLGAGISVDAGIPLGNQLAKYLIRVTKFAELQRHTTQLSKLRFSLLESLWPSRHELAVDLLVASQNTRLSTLDRNAARDIGRLMCISELQQQHPSVAAAVKADFLSPSDSFITAMMGGTSYRALLSFLTDNDQSMIDACIDHFVRDREPTTVHQFLAFLARDLGVTLFLTTNFDPLLERALTAEHRAVTTYEITGSDSIPAARLVASQTCSVIKLHGGAHHVRIGIDLDQPMPKQTLVAFTDIFRQSSHGGLPPLLLVLGYSGLDGRVMSLINEHITVSGRQSPSVLWVSQFDNLKELELDWRDGKVEFLQYRDGRLFLQDLYLRLRDEFPVARSHYQAVAFAPRTPINIKWDSISLSSDRARAEKQTIDAFAEKFLQSSEHFCFLHGSPHKGTSAALSRLAELAEASHKKVIWIDLAEIRTVSTFAEILSEQFSKVDARLAPLWRPLLLDTALRVPRVPAAPSTVIESNILVRWLQHALRRGNYLLAVDSLEQFAVLHPGTEASGGSSWLGEERERLINILKAISRDPSFVGDSKIALAASFDDNSTAERVAYQKLLTCRQVYKVERETPPPAPNDYSETERLVLEILASARRPVPLTAFGWVAARVSDATSRESISESLEELVNEKRDVSPTPGGTYWIHSSLRARLLEERYSRRHAVHDALAQFYWQEVYLRSRDVRAFLEYLFHRVAHLRATNDVHSLEKLGASLENELETLLARGRIPSILFLLRQLWDAIQEISGKALWIKSRRPGSDLTKSLLNCCDQILRVEAELVMASGHPHSALDFQLMRARLWISGRSDDLLDRSALNQIVDELTRDRHDEQFTLSHIEPLVLADLCSGLAYALQGPFEQCGGIAKFDGWTGQSIGRIERLNHAMALYQAAIRSVNAVSEHSTGRTELSMRIARRRTELLIMRGSKDRFMPRSGGSDPGRLSPEITKEILDELQRQLDGCKMIRLSRRLHRHRCYLSTQKALVKHLSYEAPAASLVPNPESVTILREAESYLNRDGGAAERQALAVLRLASAIIHIECAEGLAEQHKDAMPERQEELTTGILRNLSVAALSLEETNSLMRTGRGELRWRQLLTLYSARYWMAHAVAQPTTQAGSLFKAGRYIGAGLTNCGRMTDRRVIFTCWWKKLKDAWLAIHTDRSKTRELIRRLGIDWDPEERDGTYCAHRLDTHL